jgi:hypothetical protein
MRIRALLNLGLIVVFVTAVPLAAGPAAGLITGGGKSLKVVDAFAFDAVGEFGDPVIRVRLSDRLLDRSALGTVIDVAFELDVQRGTAGYLDLYVDRKTGAYAGATYELGAGVSCAFCMEPAVSDGSKLRIEAGHVQGTIKVPAGSYNGGKGVGFDVTLDVPIAVVTDVTPLPNAAASAEAKVLQACRALVAKEDDAARASCFTADNPAMRSIKGTDASLFWTMLTAYDPVFEMTALRVTGGRTRGEWVELSVEGLASGANAKGLVYLRRTSSGVKYSHSVIE